MKKELCFKAFITAENLIQKYLKNNDYENSMHSKTGGRLLEWCPSQKIVVLTYAFTPKWSAPISTVIEDQEIKVREKRIFEYENDCHIITSILKVHEVSLISGTIKRIIKDVNDGCIQHITIEINSESTFLNSQMTLDFFEVISNHVFPLNETNLSYNEFKDFSAGGLQVPSRATSDFALMHSCLRSIRNYSCRYMDVLNQTKLQRSELPINIESSEIEEVNNLFDPRIYSIRDELENMKKEAERTKEVINELKKSKEEVSNKGSLPLFILAACTAIVYIFASNM